MSNIIDLTGKTFGRLTVISFFGTTHDNRSIWQCLCSCGNQKRAGRSELVRGRTKSCGCLKKELLQQQLQTHGGSHNKFKTKEYRCWNGIKTRCNNTSNPSYKYYGARGIKSLRQVARILWKFSNRYGTSTKP